MPAVDDEMKRRFDALPEGTADAIDAIMLFFETMQDHRDTVTINALTEGVLLAMADGHERAELYLGMMSIAVRGAGSGVSEDSDP